MTGFACSMSNPRVTTATSCAPTMLICMGVRHTRGHVLLRSIHTSEEIFSVSMAPLISWTSGDTSSAGLGVVRRTVAWTLAASADVTLFRSTRPPASYTTPPRSSRRCCSMQMPVYPDYFEALSSLIPRFFSTSSWHDPEFFDGWKVADWNF